MKKLSNLLNRPATKQMVFVALFAFIIFAFLLTSCQSKSSIKAEQMIEKSLERQANSRNYEFVHYNPEMFVIINDTIATRQSGTSKIVYKLNKDDNRYYLCE